MAKKSTTPVKLWRSLFYFIDNQVLSRRLGVGGEIAGEIKTHFLKKKIN
jgi:hypothetical protein